MLKNLNDYQGLLALISLIVTLLGFFITNKNIHKHSQKQNSGKGSVNNQAGRDQITRG